MTFSDLSQVEAYINMFDKSVHDLIITIEYLREMNGKFHFLPEHEDDGLGIFSPALERIANRLKNLTFVVTLDKK